MTARRLPYLAGLLLLAVPASAQLSGYISAGYGYHNNPLYNYQRQGDQLTQSYTELNFVEADRSSLFRVSYVSGLMLFNSLTDRNYYEHSLTGTYRWLFRNEPPVFQSAPAGDEGSSEEEADEEEGVTPDVEAFPSFDLVLKIGARHDKQVFKEFDNFGTELTASWRFFIGDAMSFRIGNMLGYRRYVYLSPLSNITDILDLQFGRRTGPGFDYGLRGGAGLKHFTTTVYDTTRFETKRTYVRKVVGKGKGGAIIKLVPSEKQLLINPETENIWQLFLGAYTGFRWAEGSAIMEFMYRRNPGLPTRYLAQYANTSILNEDIYNDQFSYEGPGLALTLRERLPFALQSILTLGIQRKTYGAPALNLNGESTADHRIDLRIAGELYVSRYFDIGGGLGLDLALSAGVLRNQSNDAYNDFSVSSISSSIGLGF